MRETVAVASTSDRRYGVEALFRLLDPFVGDYDRVWIAPAIHADSSRPSTDRDVLYQIVMEIKERSPLPITIVHRDREAFRRWGGASLVNELGVQSQDLNALPDEEWSEVGELGLRLPGVLKDGSTFLIATCDLWVEMPQAVEVGLSHCRGLIREGHQGDMEPSTSIWRKILRPSMTILDGAEGKVVGTSGDRSVDEPIRTPGLIGGFDGAAVDAVGLAYAEAYSRFRGLAPKDVLARAGEATNAKGRDDIELRTDGKTKALIDALDRAFV